jgi:hypothetical protein
VQNCSSVHERVKTDPKAFGVAKSLSNPLSNRHENSLCIRALSGFRRSRRRGETTTLHVPIARTSEPKGHGRLCNIRSRPRISENDVMAFYPYTAANGSYGALFKLDEHGLVAPDALSIERRGSLLFVFINGRPITELEIDRRVSDGKIYIPSGLTSADIELMKKD